MEKLLLLRNYLYSVPASLALPISRRADRPVFSEHGHFLKMDFDFEEGSLIMEGDWRFLMASNKHSEAGWLAYHKKRVYIDVAIFPALPLKLGSSESDESLIQLEGTIDDGEKSGSCSGMLIVEKACGLQAPHWIINFYLYDLQLENCEMMLRLPVYVTDTTDGLN